MQYNNVYIKINATESFIYDYRDTYYKKQKDGDLNWVKGLVLDSVVLKISMLE